MRVFTPWNFSLSWLRTLTSLGVSVRRSLALDGNGVESLEASFSWLLNGLNGGSLLSFNGFTAKDGLLADAAGSDV